MKEWIRNLFGSIFGIGVFILIGWAVVSAFDSGPSDYDPGSDDSCYENTGSIGGSSYYADDYDEEEERPDGTYTVEACSQNSGNCYDLDADISDGVVEEIYFPNGGYLQLDDAELDEDGYAEGESWSYGEGYNGDYWEINCYDC